VNARERGARAADQRLDELARTKHRAEAVRNEVDAARAERERIAEAIRSTDEHLAALGEQLGALRTELAALEALHARIRTEIASTEASRQAAVVRLEQLDTQRVELAARDAELSRDMDRLLGDLEPAEEELQSAEQRRAELLAERQSVDQQLAVLRAAERAAHDVREARHVAAQRAVDEVERLNTEIAETAELEAEVTGGGVAWAEQLRLQFDTEPEPQPGFDLDAARRRIATLQRELRAVGGVAESVIDEYREMSERHSFLEHQSADLQAAMADLETAAAELEAHMREQFASAFSAIQTAFQECFTELFGGGEAKLVLTEPDDLLRTGIDILARPPGKKMQGLLSLSGGERALTIVSLLFGLLKINPTPFCVLDEVDAALDEANVQRFANLLAEFARRIQFIVVTHNRATMDKADAMYGVSMDAAGVSHVFSVRPKVLATEAVSS
jgi:chromosome segregation protein